jgi:anti-sigma regulatory factor (Ser/Thr protein kinase)
MSSTCVAINEPSATSDVRRLASQKAREAGLNDVETGRVALVATELATNLVKHAGTGLMILRSLADEPRKGVEILCLDSGPGIANVGAALRDGYSTAGSPGTGLGAIQRMSDLFEVYSSPGLGTAVLAQVRLRPRPDHPPPHRQALVVGGVSVPKSGEIECGDSWGKYQSGKRALIAVVDGLGHGLAAAQASREAVRVFQEWPSLPPAEIIGRMHGALRSTRGAAAAVAEVDLNTRELRFAGVGNIAGVIQSSQGRRQVISHNGIVGHEMRKVQEFTYPWPDDGLLVLYSDGINTHWDLDRYPGLVRCHPALVSGILFRDSNRGRDDATAVVARQEPAR